MTAYSWRTNSPFSVPETIIILAEDLDVEGNMEPLKWPPEKVRKGLLSIHLVFRWGNRVRELEKKYKEEEKTAIHSMVAAAELTPEQLSQIIRMAKAGELYYGALAEKYEEEMG